MISVLNLLRLVFCHTVCLMPFYLWFSGYLCLHCGFLSLFLKILFIFREGKAGGEGEKHQCVIASHAPLLGTQCATQACALTGN